MFSFLNPWAYARKRRDARQKEQDRLAQIKRDALLMRLKNIVAAARKRDDDAYYQLRVSAASNLAAQNSAADWRQGQQAYMSTVWLTEYDVGRWNNPHDKASHPYCTNSAPSSSSVDESSSDSSSSCANSAAGNSD